MKYQQRSTWLAVLRAAAGLLLTASIIALWAMTLRPQSLGGPTEYVGVSGVSMTPALHNGDLAIVQRESTYEVGDIVAYRIPKGEIGGGMKVIHRIIGGNAVDGFSMKGDYNNFVDEWHPTNKQIVGKVWRNAPGAARTLQKLREPLPFAIVIGLLSFAVVAWPAKRQHQEPVAA